MPSQEKLTFKDWAFVAGLVVVYHLVLFGIIGYFMIPMLPQEYRTIAWWVAVMAHVLFWTYLVYRFIKYANKASSKEYPKDGYSLAGDVLFKKLD